MSALGVIWGHSMYNISLPLELNGAFWVWIFLPISGYLIGTGFKSNRYALNFKGYKLFIWNRMLRIIPLYEIALLLGLLMEILSNQHAGTFLSNIRQFAYISPLNAISLVGPLWTVAAEVQFYIFSLFIFLFITGQWRKSP